MSYVKKKSVLPIYLIGFTWLLWSVFFPLYRLTDYIIAALVSLIAYGVGEIIFPDRGYQIADQGAAVSEPKPQTSASTGNPEIDALISERDRAISEMRRLNASIQNPGISRQISRLEAATGKIIGAVVDKPAKLPQLRRFLNYYLPTTLKLLNAYDRMDATGVSGANIDGAKGKIEDIMEAICKAFDRQLDSLYGEEALDISTDISVLENMLAQEGLAGMTFDTGE